MRKLYVDLILNFDMDILEEHILQDPWISSMQSFSSEVSNLRLIEELEYSDLLLTLDQIMN